jgi:hypothetical protein
MWVVRVPLGDLCGAGSAAHTRRGASARARPGLLNRLAGAGRCLSGPEGVGRDAVLFELGVERGARDVEQV